MYKPDPDNNHSPPLQAYENNPDTPAKLHVAICDAELFRCLATGDRQAWGLLYQRHWQGLVSHIIEKYSLDSHAAQDIASATLMKLWPNRRLLAAVCNPQGYLRSIANTLVADGFAKSPVDGPGLSQDMMSSLPSPIIAVEKEELAQYVREAKASLPDSHRKALEMNHEDGMSARQIAATSDSTEKAIRRRIQKAVDRLRQKLASLRP